MDIDTTQSGQVTVWLWKDLPLGPIPAHKAYHNVTLSSLRRAQRAQLVLVERKEATK